MLGAATGVPTIICPVCHHKKAPVQRDLICGNCIHHSTEIIRNSVIENETRNTQMRAQIDSIFSTCREINAGNDQYTAEWGMDNDVVSSPPKTSSTNEILQPGTSSVRQLALHLQKLELINRRIKSHGLEKSRDSLVKKNTILEAKIAALTQKITENNHIFHSKEATMSEAYSRKLEHLDREIISVQYEGMRRVSRQAALKQYSSYKVIREIYFSSRRVKDPVKKSEMLFCSRPVLPISSFLGAQITTINTFLEELIRLQIILFDLFKIDHDSLELPYLEYLRKLLPERNFYDSVQTKINSILQTDHMPETDETKKDVSPLLEDIHPNEISQDFDKITIKNNVIRVPMSFRTMNLQRRFSMKDTELSDRNPVPRPGKTHHDGIKSAFVMVPQERNIIDDDLSPKSSAMPLSNPTRIATDDIRDKAPKTEEQNCHKKNPQDVNIPKHDLSGKKIVIVPHKILTKPFSKLRPNEYLKFVSIVVKILVTYNEFFEHVLGPVSIKDNESYSMHILSSSSSRSRMEVQPDVSRRPFLNDFEAILSQIANMDHYFQQKPNMYNDKFEAGAAKISRISNSIDASQMSNITEEDKHSRDSWEIEADVPAAPAPLSSFSKVKEIYTKFMSRAKGSEPSPELTSVSDNVIYGMVSETTTRKEDQQKANSRKQKEDASKENTSTEYQLTTDYFDYNLKEISKKVHDLMAGKALGKDASGGARGRGASGLAKDRAGANSIMQQSRAHLEDWDVVSKMF
ncbi:hypothetical protein JCM33374_g5552 [Metschnikowia sp. JCM 33374]|nr:hypothetical protein JCM33374_g5552 [Metschnikowia sp. JCM 33374]